MKDATNYSLHLCLAVLALWLFTAHTILAVLFGVCYQNGRDFDRIVMATIAAMLSVWLASRMFGHCHRYGRQIVITLWRNDQNQQALRQALDGSFERALSNGHGKVKRRA